MWNSGTSAIKTYKVLVKRAKILPPTSMKCFAAKPERGARKQEIFCKYNNVFF